MYVWILQHVITDLLTFLFEAPCLKRQVSLEAQMTNVTFSFNTPNTAVLLYTELTAYKLTIYTILLRIFACITDL